LTVFLKVFKVINIIRVSDLRIKEAINIYMMN